MPYALDADTPSRFSARVRAAVSEPAVRSCAPVKPPLLRGLSVIVPRLALRRGYTYRACADGRASTRHPHGITERAASHRGILFGGSVGGHYPLRARSPSAGR
eukprot:scaffold71876_cov24-Phaeocystis_antarctica.AAC.1